MQILLIQPKFTSDPKYTKKLSDKLSIYPDLTIAQLSGLTPQKHTVKALFEKYQRVNFNIDVDLVGITCTTPLALRAYEIADEFRKRGVKVVLGGWHASVLPDEAKKHADSVVIGESDITWPKLLNDLEHGNLQHFYQNKIPVNSEFIKRANRNIHKKVEFIAGIQATRGCPMGCEFCGISNSRDGRIFRKRPINEVVEEIKSVKQRKLYFYDPSLTINPSYTKELFKAMKDLNKKFTCFGNIDILGKDEEFLKIASEAGCQNWYVGFESVSQETINQLGKKSNKVENYSTAIEMTHNYGMSVIGAFIFGFDTDKINVFESTIEMVFTLNIDFAEFTILTPYPGTPLFERLDKEKRILTRDWSKYTEMGNVVFMPKHMTPEELLEGTERVRKEINSFSGISKRLLSAKKFSLHNVVGNIFQYA